VNTSSQTKVTMVDDPSDENGLDDLSSALMPPAKDTGQNSADPARPSFQRCFDHDAADSVSSPLAKNVLGVFFSILWIALLLFIAWPIAGFCSVIWVFLQVR
jgi:hypothetical protein